MKSNISRFIVVAAIAALMILVGTPSVLAQTPNFPNFTGATNLTFKGSAALNGSVLRLTTNAQGEAGAAWFNTQQPVAGGFSTTFTFQIAGANTNLDGCTKIAGFCPADGIAFVIQNSSVNALGRTGCGIGFGGNPFCAGDGTGGIPQSLAVEFDTFQNEHDPNANHVSIQSCLTSANSTDSGICRIADNSSLPVTLADGGVHTVTISYAPPASGSGAGILNVILDNHELFTSGVSFDLTSLSLASGGNAFVGFTAATGGADDNQDILSWTFTPQAQSAPVSTTTQAVLKFNGGTGNNAYDYNALLTGGGAHPVTSATVTIKPILMSEEACERLVDANPKFGKAQCFVYQNAGKDSAGNTVDSAVLFELTCPDQTGGTCGSPSAQNFFATLGSNFVFTKAENPGFNLLNSTIGPYPGWLKGDGGVSGSPCTPPATGALFQSNQITSFSVVGDPTATTKGKSGGTGSCWVATFFTGGELPPAIKITSPTFTTYTKGQVVLASYTCKTPVTSKDESNPSNTTGPYLTVQSCTQSQAPNNNTSATCGDPTFAGGISCTNGVVDTSVKGLHAFQVKATDSGGNVNVNLVLYNVR